MICDETAKLVDVHPRIAQSQAVKFFEGKSEWNKLVSQLRKERIRYSRSKASQDAFETAMYGVDKRARLNGVESLTQMKDGESLADLIQGCEYPDVRIEAGFKLANLTQNEDIRAIEGLVIALDDEEKCHYACTILGKIGHPNAAPKLFEMLDDNSRRQPTRFYVLNALREIKDESVTFEFIRILGEIADPQVREGIVEELTERRHPASATALKEALFDFDIGNHIHQRAIEALKTIQNPDTISSLINIFAEEDSSIHMRRRATTVLAQFGNYTIPFLEEAMNHELRQVRSAADTVLRRIDTPEAWEILKKHRWP